jgi:pyrimidine-specific ribonucleoside hydrolase
MPTPVYIDTDLGTDVDDALAFALAALDARFDLRGVATVNGPVRDRAVQVRGVLELCGRDDVPVAIGRAEPLAGGASSGMPVGLVADGPLGTLPDDVPSSEQLLVDVLRAADTSDPVHVCVIGAMTNVARDLAAHPELFDRVALHVMAGCLGPNPNAEFNLNGDADADASRIVHSLPLPIVLAPYDVTAPLCLTDDDIAHIAACGALGAALERQMQRWVTFMQRLNPKQAANARVRLHDPLCVLHVVDPDVATTAEMHLSLQGGPGDLFYVESPVGRPVNVMRTADEARLRAALLAAITPRG